MIVNAFQRKQESVPNFFVSEGRCQFCHNTAGNVDAMIAGDSGFICNQCVQACAALLQPAEAAAPEHATSAAADRYVFQRLARHFAPMRPHEMMATSRAYPLRQQADLQAALDDLFGERHVPQNFVGIHQRYRQEVVDFTKLLEQSHGAIEVAPAQFEDIDIGGETIRCLKNGLWLLKDERGPYAVVLSQHDDYRGGSNLLVEIAAPPGELGVSLCTRVFDALEARLSKESCYRGRVLSLEASYHYSGHAGRIRVHALQPVTREEVILPEETLRTLERNVLTFAEQRPALRALGLSGQKGLLFHGAPGTGKTHCIRYLAGRLHGHTTLLITAEEMGALPEYMSLAGCCSRRARHRGRGSHRARSIGARERLRRSNAQPSAQRAGWFARARRRLLRADHEPAGHARAGLGEPAGRIDQAIEFPLPSEPLRRRLVALYARALPISSSLMDKLAARTDGASPAFIKEFLRRIAQHHLDAGNPEEVSAATADAALHEMLFSGGALNATVLGAGARGTLASLKSEV
jgi:hypothetical protein